MQQTLCRSWYKSEPGVGGSWHPNAGGCDMRLAHAQRAALAWDRSTGMGIKCPKETLSNTRHRTQYKLEIKAAIKVIRLLGLLTPCAFLMAEAAADLLVHSLGLRSQHSPALARASSPGAVLVRQPASLLAPCLFSEKIKRLALWRC